VYYFNKTLLLNNMALNTKTVLSKSYLYMFKGNLVVMILLLFCNAQLLGQSQYLLNITVSDMDSSAFYEEFKYAKQFKSKEGHHDVLKKLLIDLYDAAYITARFDSIKINQNEALAYLTIGKQIKWAKLSPGSIDEGALSQIGFRDKMYRNKTFHHADLKKLSNKLLSYYESNGYPFAQIWFDELELENEELSLLLNLDKKREIRIDSIILHGNLDISRIYLRSYLGIKPGKLYDESVVSKIDKRLKELPFLSSTEPFSLVFYPTSDEKGKVLIHLFLEEKKANQLDGIVGILPGKGADRKVNIFGEGHMKLQNPFGGGKIIEAKWRKIQFKTQDLKVRFEYPFMLSTPFGSELALKIYKKDTTFLDVDKYLAVQYLITGRSYFKAFFKNKTSSLLSTTNLSSTSVPDFADVNSSIYGLGYRIENLDYRLNPRKGFVVESEMGAGNKVVRKNDALSSEVYDELELKTLKFDLNIQVEAYLPIRSRSVIKIGNASSKLINKNLFENELYRIGGLKSLRGFDEEAIYASSFSITTLEYRFLLDQNSYINLFIDGGYYENVTNNKAEYDTPYGFGAGLSFETKAGIFTINYALGAQKGNSPDLRTAKIHFGLVNYF